MQEIAPGVYQLWGFPPHTINIYLIGRVLVDAGTRFDQWRIMRQLRGHQVAAHLLTHVHPDHQGASAAVCQKLGIPLWCGTHDAAAMETGDISRQFPAPLNPGLWLMNALWSGPAYPVTRHLIAGDLIEGFEVLETPGHTPGHISLWREHDRVLIVGDVLNNMGPSAVGTEGLNEAPPIFTPDMTRNRQSARALAALRPRIACFGHGPPLYDTDKFLAFVAGLPVA
jgi:glyoxylase-like metal-dependent hydrolase (beta-lactamase superfamily II)